MTRDELKLHFDLKPCPNPKHEFSIGNLIGEWRWSEDFWAQLVGENLQTLYLSFHTTKNTNGTVIYCITIFKLKIIFGLVK